MQLFTGVAFATPHACMHAWHKTLCIHNSTEKSCASKFLASTCARRPHHINTLIYNHREMGEFKAMVADKRVAEHAANTPHHHLAQCCLSTHISIIFSLSSVDIFFLFLSFFLIFLLHDAIYMQKESRRKDHAKIISYVSNTFPKEKKVSAMSLSHPKCPRTRRSHLQFSCPYPRSQRASCPSPP